MSSNPAATGLQLRSLVKPSGELEISLLSVATPEPAPDEVEAALSRTATEYSRYGSTTHKQVYIYGGLDTGPTEFNRNFGFAWGMGVAVVFFPAAY